MLSVRSLKKIAARRKPLLQVVAVDSGLAEGLGGADTALPLGTPQGLPAPTGNEPPAGKKKVTIAESSNVVEEGEGRKGSWSLSVMYASLVSTLAEAQRQGAGDFLLAVALLTSSVYVLKWMYLKAAAVLDMEVVSSDTMMDGFLHFVEGNPILFLIVTFGGATLIGVAFFFLEEIKMWIQTAKKRVGRHKDGYMQLDDEHKDPQDDDKRTMKTFISAFGSKKAGLLPGMSYQEAFTALDKDGSGTVSTDELRSALKKGEQTYLTDAEIMRVIGTFDENSDGELQPNEFENFWNYFQTEEEAARQARAGTRGNLGSLADGAHNRLHPDLEAAAGAPAGTGSIPESAKSIDDLKSELRFLTDKCEVHCAQPCIDPCCASLLSGSVSWLPVMHCPTSPLISRLCLWPVCTGTGHQIPRAASQSSTHFRSQRSPGRAQNYKRSARCPPSTITRRCPSHSKG